ncbi:MAG: hypothetical protein MZV65_47895 [Chromatiales bacterium]|nr:hypothetical protein [Chromatiales bacterium]
MERSLRVLDGAVVVF